MEDGIIKDAPEAIQNMSYEQLLSARNNSSSSSSEGSRSGEGDQNNSSKSPDNGSSDSNGSKSNANTSREKEGNGGHDSAAQPTFDLSVFKEVLGREFKDAEEVTSYLSELKKAEESFIKPDSIPESVKAHWDLVKSGKSDRDFYRELAADYESMGDFDVILESELKSEKNKDRDRDLVSRMVKRELRKDIETIDQAEQIAKFSQEELEDYMDEHGLSTKEIEAIKEDAEFAKLTMKEKAENARKGLIENQSKLLKYEAPKQQLDPETQRFLESHQRRLETVAKDFESVSFSVGKEGVDPYRLSLNGKDAEETQKNREDFKKYMEDPFIATNEKLKQNFIKEGTLDYEGLSKFYHVLNNWDKLPELITEHISHNANIRTIEKEKVNPANQNAQGVKTEKTRHEAMLEAAHKARAQGLI